jgi:hypothetical protein
MARLWRDQGKRNEGDLYGWFTVDTHDFNEAMALFDALAS